MAKIDRHDYAALYGPTTGDQVRLGDTALTAVVEKDHAVYGDECLHGGGKTLRDGIGMAGITSAEGALDFLLCNVVIIDPVIGIVKGDLGIRHGRIVGIGKAGNPAIMDGVDPRLIVSSGTTVRDCEGLIATPGRDRCSRSLRQRRSGRACAGERDHHDDRRLARPDHRRDRFRRSLQHRQDAAGRGSLADEFRLSRARQFASRRRRWSSSSRPASWV